ncbi:MAG: PLP-dependent aminotransferase family protein [Halothermotrichaceae bacterium]
MNKNLFAERVKCMDNGELADLMRLVGRDDIISFAGGIPSADIFPLKKLKELTANLFNSHGADIFQYCSTEGSNQLKKSIVDFLEMRNLNINARELLITTGSQQALDLISKIFINPGDKIIVENPGYVGGIGAIKSYQAELIGIDMDQDGMKVDLLARKLKELYQNGDKVKFVYLVPDYSNPSGARLSLERRKKILQFAEKYDFYIIEDTPYSELNYFEERIPYIKEFDENDRVILLGSFSKFFIPGMRVGWIVSTEDMIGVFSRAKQNTDLASNTYGQELIAAAAGKGLFEEQIERVKPFYRERLEHMQESLKKYFPESTSWIKSRGGFFFWVQLPEHIKSSDLLKTAIDNNVAFVTGNSFFADAKEGDNYMRLSFSDTKPEKIDEGIKKLAKLIKDY